MELKKYFLKIGGALLLFLNLSSTYAQTVFQVKTNEIKTQIPSTLWGIFFEDINLGADGGLYAELVKNRSFEFDQPLMGWKEVKDHGATGSLLVNNESAINNSNTRFIHIESSSDQGYGLANEGFRGMGIKKGETYNFSVMARQTGGSQAGLVIILMNEAGDQLGAAKVQPNSTEWKTYKVSFKANETDLKAHLNVLMNGKGAMDLDMISLFPEHTWKNRPNGLRADMVQLLADMKPGFLRFPGGCIVEGRTLDTRFQWKNTIGNLTDRKTIINRWNIEFKHRLTPDYYQSFGLGFYEYFQLCEDIGAAPLPILNCGMACQFNSSEVVPIGQLQPYIQDALDLIEFANGPANSKWGKIRAYMGHPAPFNMKLLGVGNEQWGPQYTERYKVFEKAIKAKYPYIKLVCSVGPDPDGPKFDYLNKTLRALNADILDEHYYRSPEWFFDHANRYDNYDRKGPKIFAGEYAAQSVGIASPLNKNTWKCALSEAAFMTGLERNADVVDMASYAPLFAHIEGWQWTPDLIWVNNLHSYGTADYQVQKLFSINKGTAVVPILLNNQAVSGQLGYYATACIDKNTKELIIKLVSNNAQSQNIQLNLTGNHFAKQGELTVLSNSDLEAVNSFDHPDEIAPTQQAIPVKGKKLNLVLKPYSFNVIKLKLL